MSRKLWVALLLVGLAVYVGYLVWILQPYFRTAEAHVVWQLTPSLPVTQVHIGDRGTVFATGGDGLVMISPDGDERYVKRDDPNGWSYGYDENGEDTLYFCQVTWFNEELLQQYQQQYGGNFFYDPSQGRYSSQTKQTDPAGAEQPAEPVFKADLTCVDSDGTVRFVQEVELKGFVQNLWCNAGRVYFMDSAEMIHCFSEEGELLWEQRFPGLHDFNKAQDGRLFVNAGSEIIAIDADGNELWRNSLGPGARIDDWRNWSESGGRLCVVHDGNALSVLGLDGAVEWTHQLWAGNSYYGQYNYNRDGQAVELLQDGAVYALDSDAVFWRLKPGGGVDWRFQVGGNPTGFCSADDGMAYVQSNRRGLLALSPRGRLIWRDPQLGDGGARPKLGPDGRLYIVNHGRILAIDLAKTK